MNMADCRVTKRTDTYAPAGRVVVRSSTARRQAGLVVVFHQHPLNRTIASALDELTNARPHSHPLHKYLTAPVI